MDRQSRSYGEAAAGTPRPPDLLAEDLSRRRSTHRRAPPLFFPCGGAKNRRGFRAERSNDLTNRAGALVVVQNHQSIICRRWLSLEMEPHNIYEYRQRPDRGLREFNSPPTTMNGRRIFTQRGSRRVLVRRLPVVEAAPPPSEFSYNSMTGRVVYFDHLPIQIQRKGNVHRLT